MTFQRIEPHGPGLKNYSREARKAPNRVTTGSANISCWSTMTEPTGSREPSLAGEPGSQGKREAPGQPG